MSKPDVNDLTSDANLEAGAMPTPKRLSNKPIIICVVLVVLFVIVIIYGVNASSKKKAEAESEANKPAVATEDMRRTEKPNFLGDQNKVTIEDKESDVNQNFENRAEIQTEQEDHSEEKLKELNEQLESLKLEIQAYRQKDNVNANTNMSEAEAARQRAILDLKRELAERKKQAYIHTLEASSTVSINFNGSAGGNANSAMMNLPANATTAQKKAAVEAEQRRVQAQLASLNSGTTGTSVAGLGGVTNLNPRTELSSFGAGGGAYGNSNSMGGADGLISNSQTLSGYNNLKNNEAGTVTIENPQYKYMIRRGFVIPATTITGINSDLPGQLIAHVNQNVYDTATGKYLLIPEGTRLVGTYASGVIYGQERVMIAWNLLIYPDNKSVDLGAMPGADVSGYSGFSDQVNNHWMKLISSAFLMSGITASVAVAVDHNSNNSNDSDNTSVNSELASALASQLGTVTANVIQRNLNVSPTLEIRPGYNFNVMITKDIVFDKPYKSFDYQ